jgi:acyl-CoA synthetase (AMP-forming)/AMP-acid ligase II
MMQHSVKNLRNFYDNLASFGSAPALITGRETFSYESIDRASRRIASDIGPTRRLIFLEASNTPDAICTYLACLIGQHPVWLFSPQDEDRVVVLANIYRPNRIYSSVAGKLQLRKIHDDVIPLHPDLRVLLSTSGSTGSPKLVKLSARNIQSNAEAIVEYLQLGATERALLSLKFNYSYGMSVVNSHLLCGGALILTDASVLDDEHWDLFSRLQATSFAGVPYTFETLFRSGDQRFATASLRYITQAGGRLSPELVRHFANLGQANNWRFYVMYGQTEAAPRMTYLPPHEATNYPDCIGVPIPGGRISLLNPNDHEIGDADTPGELAYHGPNVMMGYAQVPQDLAVDNTPPFLLTGDIACRNSAGLYYITGRSSRFVKPFGIRVNLDDIEAHIRALASQAVCTGIEERIVVALPREQYSPALAADIRKLAADYRLPDMAIQVFEVAEVPRFPTGKIDYSAIAELAQEALQMPGARISARARIKRALSIIGSREYVLQISLELKHMLGLIQQSAHGVAEIYGSLLPNRPMSAQSTFTDLAGDSLSYVQASLAIEEYLGELPLKWERMTIAELEQRHAANTNV